MEVAQLQRFVGNPDAYALQREDGGYQPIRKKVTNSLLKKHLAGELTVGTYVNMGTMANFVVFDVDTGDEAEDQANRVRDAIMEMGVKPYAVGIEFSGRKGYHVWMPRITTAQELRRFGRAVLALAEVECEVFPKQDDVRDLGNLIKLPGGKHQVSGLPSKWLTELPFAMPEALWQSAVVPNLPPELTGRKFNAGVSERFPCIDAIQEQGATEGSRNNELFHLATMLRRAGVSHEYVVRIVEEVNEKGDPLDPFELGNLLQSAEFSGPVCDQLPENRKCGDLCIRARTSGLYTRPRQLRHAQVGENVVVTVSNRDGQNVEFEHDDLKAAKGVLT